jgi:flagellar basal-body rod modification protein FlgD
MNVSDVGLRSVEQERAREEREAQRRRGDLGQSEFLRLLTTQLQQQNPLDPVDNQAFVAQLSQFSSLELLQGMSAALEGLALAQAANTSAQMVSFIGTEVTTATPEVRVDAERRGAELGYRAARPLSELTLTIRDEAGSVVRTVALGSREAGYGEVEWDGIGQDGNPVAPGVYTVSFQGRDESGQPVEVLGYTKQRVSGVSYAGGFPVLLLESGIEAPLGSIREIRSGRGVGETGR